MTEEDYAKMKNEIIYEEDPRVVFDYCRRNTEEQAMMKIIADEFLNLADLIQLEKSNSTLQKP